MTGCHGANHPCMCSNVSTLSQSLAVMQKLSMQTERTLSIPLVDSRGHGGMATMDPAGSAVLDHLFSAGGHL